MIVIPLTTNLKNRKFNSLPRIDKAEKEKQLRMAELCADIAKGGK
jgi:hypothetical protein